MKKKLGLILALSIIITGINYPVCNVHAQEENQIESEEALQVDDNDVDSSSQQENMESSQDEETDVDTESVTEDEQVQNNLRENSWRYQDGELITSEEDEISLLSEIYAPNATRKGIDVSEHNGTIDWDKVKAAGIDYAIIRCGYGDDYSFQDDIQWQRNVSECERLGIPYGVYIYSYATDTTMAASEAQHVLRLTSGHNLTYPVYFDMEDNSTLGSDFGAIAQTFCSTIQNAGYAVGVYANLNWWNNYLTDARFEQWYRWVAQYNIECDYTGIYAMWQYSSNEYVDGISGRVDMNYLIGTPANHGDKILQRGVLYKAHVSNIGWQEFAQNGDLAGTIGQNKGIEALKIQLNDIEGNIEYRAHVQDIGWQDYVENGDLAGTTGKAKPIEAVSIRLTGEAAEEYDIYYRVHSSDFGWLGWAKNGEDAGTQGYAKKVEAIQIQLVEKNGTAPGDTSNAFRVRGTEVQYQAHVSDSGWQNCVVNGETAGTTGQNKGIEALKLQLNNAGNSGIEYRAHVSDIGWQDYVSNGDQAGTTGKAKPIEAVSIRLTGEAAEKYDIYYRVHSSDFGWLGWAKNGEDAGTQGYAKKVEAIQIQLVEKNGTAPGDTSNAFRVRGTEVQYQAHVSDSGWQNCVVNGETAGTTGQNKGIEALKLQLNNAGNSGIEYRAHVSDIGWQDYVSNGNQAGTTGRAKSIEAVSIRLTGEAAEKYDIYYRVHSSDFGWLGWAKNGENAGTQGYAKKVEAIEICLVAKGSSAPGSTEKVFVKKN